MRKTPVHNFTLKQTLGHWLIEISPSSNYGYFENQKTGIGGGLWFEFGVLTDYDGVFELPTNVAQAIVNLGYKL